MNTASIYALPGPSEGQGIKDGRIHMETALLNFRPPYDLFILTGFQHRTNSKESSQHNQDKLKWMSLRLWWQIDTVPGYWLCLVKENWNEGFGWSWPAARLCRVLLSVSCPFRQGWPCGFMPPTLTILAEQESQRILRWGIEEEQEAGGLCCHKAQCDGFLGWGCICVDSWRREACVLGHRVWFLKHVCNRAARIKKSWNLCKKRRQESTFSNTESTTWSNFNACPLFPCTQHCVRAVKKKLDNVLNNFEEAQIYSCVWSHMCMRIHVRN